MLIISCYALNMCILVMLFRDFCKSYSFSVSLDSEESREMRACTKWDLKYTVVEQGQDH